MSYLRRRRRKREKEMRKERETEMRKGKINYSAEKPPELQMSQWCRRSRLC